MIWLWCIVSFLAAVLIMAIAFFGLLYLSYSYVWECVLGEKSDSFLVWFYKCYIRKSKAVKA